MGEDRSTRLAPRAYSLEALRAVPRAGRSAHPRAPPFGPRDLVVATGRTRYSARRGPRDFGRAAATTHPETPLNPRSRIPISALLIPGLALGFAALFGTQAWVQARLLSLSIVPSDVVIESLSRWLLYAAFAPLIGILVARFPLERGRMARHAAVHVIAAVTFAALHAVGMGLVYRAFHVYPPEDALVEAIGRLLLVFFSVNFVVFCSIAGVYHALRYHEEVRRRDQLAATLRASLTEARLDTLRAQLNPHFLFNTLNAVSTLALTGERDQVAETLGRLSELLRISMDPGLPQEIPLARELGILEGYLDIQRVRFGERLTVVTDIAPSARDALFPCMMLQPLVENALQHGIEARPGPGRVAVVGRREADTLRVRVEDTGPGFAPASDGGGRQGIGLANTRARLEQLHGASSSLVCGNLPGGGAFVEVVLPYCTHASNGGAP